MKDPTLTELAEHLAAIDPKSDPREIAAAIDLDECAAYHLAKWCVHLGSLLLTRTANAGIRCEAADVLAEFLVLRAKVVYPAPRPAAPAIVVEESPITPTDADQPRQWN